MSTNVIEPEGNVLIVLDLWGETCTTGGESMTGGRFDSNVCSARGLPEGRDAVFAPKAESAGDCAAEPNFFLLSDEMLPF